jgi:hypothetical protein
VASQDGTPSSWSSRRTERDCDRSATDQYIEQQDVCRGCALGKFAKASFPSSDSRSAGILDLDTHGRVWAHVSEVLEWL